MNSFMLIFLIRTCLCTSTYQHNDYEFEYQLEDDIREEKNILLLVFTLSNLPKHLSKTTLILGF